MAGIAYDDMEETREQSLNYLGSDLGVQGELRLNEANHVYDFDQYLQAQWDPDALWRLTAGARNNLVQVDSHNDMPDAADPDTGVRYTAIDPVAAALFHASPAVILYASYGKGFETPTLNDLAYRSTDGSVPGLNIGLQPARSDNYEVGAKTATGPVRAELAGFYIKTRDELAVQQNFNGRTVEQNIGETTRRGVELTFDASWRGGFSARVAYTYIRAIVEAAYGTCVGTPCRPAVVEAGSYLPAVPMNALYASLSWNDAPAGFSARLETQGRARIYADDRNTAYAAGYWEENLWAGLEQETKHWRFREFARVDNLTNRAYVGTVIVNASNAQYFEPSPGRVSYIMFNASWRVD